MGKHKASRRRSEKAKRKRRARIRALIRPTKLPSKGKVIILRPIYLPTGLHYAEIDLVHNVGQLRSFSKAGFNRWFKAKKDEGYAILLRIKGPPQRL